MVCALWLAGPDKIADFGLYRSWNQQHPDQPMRIVYKVAEWPQFDSWATPTFYFLSKGKVRAEIVGWPRGGRKREVRSALRRIRLL